MTLWIWQTFWQTKVKQQMNTRTDGEGKIITGVLSYILYLWTCLRWRISKKRWGLIPIIRPIPTPFTHTHTYTHVYTPTHTLLPPNSFQTRQCLPYAPLQLMLYNKPRWRMLALHSCVTPKIKAIKPRLQWKCSHHTLWKKAGIR